MKGFLYLLIFLCIPSIAENVSLVCNAENRAQLNILYDGDEITDTSKRSIRARISTDFGNLDVAMVNKGSEYYFQKINYPEDIDFKGAELFSEEYFKILSEAGQVVVDLTLSRSDLTIKGFVIDRQRISFSDNQCQLVILKI